MKIGRDFRRSNSKVEQIIILFVAIARGSAPHFSPNMITIFRKKGWVLNPDDKKVNTILKMVEKNNGECPCINNSVDKHCPCTSYRDENVCHCGLYIKNE